MNSALIVDDEPTICQCLSQLLVEQDCDVKTAASAEDGLDLAENNNFDVVMLDVRLPGIDGLTALPQFRRKTSAPVIVMTAHGDLSTAVSAVQNEAFEYIPKPFDLDHVTQVIRRALAVSTTQESTLPPDRSSESADFVGSSLPMQHLFRQVAMAAQHDAPVLITGESGTGKELVAASIHRHSQRQSAPLVPVHLASLSEGLLERELFGHTAGAFTGAVQAQDGVIAKANNGTLFLDEIGETPQVFQVKLLRTIETGEYYPVGSASAQTSDFRLITATNRTTDYLKSPEHFRPDFFYRLATIHIHVPPLRDHADDIPELAAHFLKQVSPNTGRQFSPDAIQALMQRQYPGNVRELRNIVVRAAAESSEPVITAESVTLTGSTSDERNSPSAGVDFRQACRLWARQALSSKLPSPMQSATEIVESALIEEAMKLTGNNRSAAAQLLGIHRETLRDKLSRMKQSK